MWQAENIAEFAFEWGVGESLMVEYHHIFCWLVGIRLNCTTKQGISRLKALGTVISSSLIARLKKRKLDHILDPNTMLGAAVHTVHASEIRFIKSFVWRNSLKGKNVKVYPSEFWANQQLSHGGRRYCNLPKLCQSRNAFYSS